MTHHEETGAGPALVMVSGLAATREFFRAAVRDLSTDHRVVTVELPGHGDTPAGDRPVTVRRASEDLTALLRALDLRDVTLLGWSLGATVAYGCLADDAAGRIARLVSVEQTPRLLLADDWPHAAFGALDAPGAERFGAGVTADPAAFADTLVGALFAAGSRPDPEVVEALTAEVRRCDPVAVAALLADAVTTDWRGPLADVRVPTLLLHGARSQVYPTPVGGWLAERIPGARLTVFEDSGHLPFVEEDRRFAATVREFAAR